MEFERQISKYDVVFTSTKKSHALYGVTATIRLEPGTISKISVDRSLPDTLYIHTNNGNGLISVYNAKEVLIDLLEKLNEAQSIIETQKRVEG